MLIQRDKEWKVHVSDYLASTENEILAQYDPTMTSEIILPLIYTLNGASLCPGKVDFWSIQLAHNRNESFLLQGQLTVVLDENDLLKYAYTMNSILQLFDAFNMRTLYQG